MVFFIFIQILIETYASKQWRPLSDTMLDAASDLGLHYLPMSQKKTLGIYGLKMQLFCLSNKSCSNLGSIWLVKVH